MHPLTLLLYYRSGSGEISFDDLVAYAEDSGLFSCLFVAYIVLLYAGDVHSVKYAKEVLDIIDIDNDEVIGFVDFLHFAERLKLAARQNE